MKTSSLKKEGSIHNRLILAAFGFSLALTASGQDFDTDWAFAKPLPQTTRFGIRRSMAIAGAARFRIPTRTRNTVSRMRRLTD